MSFTIAGMFAHQAGRTPLIDVSSETGGLRQNASGYSMTRMRPM